MMNSAALSAKHRAVLAGARLLFSVRHPLLIARFVRRLGYLPNPAAPASYHERLLWRKIVDRNPLFVTLTDKLAAKAYVGKTSTALPQPATLWSGHDPADIPQDLLASDVVVKVNHGWTMNLFVSGGLPDRATVTRKARRWLTKRFGRRDGEWAYLPIRPAVFVEERLRLSGGIIATDVKVYVCGGHVCHAWAEDKLADRSHLFDRDGNPLLGRDSDYPREDQSLTVSTRLIGYVREAIAAAPLIAGDLDYVRVDFLVSDRGLFVGEVAVYPGAGYGTWTNPAIASEIERRWRLDQSHYLRRLHSGLARFYAEALLAKCAIDGNGRGTDQRPLSRSGRAQRT